MNCRRLKDRHCIDIFHSGLSLPSQHDHQPLNAVQGTIEVLRRRGKQPIPQPGVPTHSNSMLLPIIPSVPQTHISTSDVATQTTEWLPSPIETPNSEKEDAAPIIHRILMVTTATIPETEPRRIYTDNPFQRRVKQLLSIRCTTNEAVPDLDPDTPITTTKGTTLEYTLEFLDIVLDTVTDAYGNIFHETYHMDNYIFTQGYDDAKDQHETLIRRLGDIPQQFHAITNYTFCTTDTHFHK